MSRGFWDIFEKDENEPILGSEGDRRKTSFKVSINVHEDGEVYEIEGALNCIAYSITRIEESFKQIPRYVFYASALAGFAVSSPFWRQGADKWVKELNKIDLNL